MAFGFTFKNLFGVQELEDARTPREILTVRRSQALAEIDDHNDRVKVARATVSREQGFIDSKTKMVKDIDVALGVID